MEYIWRFNYFYPNSFALAVSEIASHVDPAALPLEALLPQRRPMLLLSRVLEGDERRAVTESVAAADWPLAGASGVEALVLVEIAAQTAGVACSCRRIREKGLDSEQRGWIVAVKRAEFFVDALPLGARIRAEAENTINYGGFQEVGCSLFRGEGREKIGEVLLQLYQPQDEDHEAI